MRFRNCHFFLTLKLKWKGLWGNSSSISGRFGLVADCVIARSLLRYTLGDVSAGADTATVDLVFISFSYQRYFFPLYRYKFKKLSHVNFDDLCNFIHQSWTQAPEEDERGMSRETSRKHRVASVDVTSHGRQTPHHGDSFGSGIFFSTRRLMSFAQRFNEKFEKGSVQFAWFTRLL